MTNLSAAQEIADLYNLVQVGECFAGECPCCGYRGFSLTEKNGRILFYCHGGGCSQDEIIDLLRENGLWGPSAMELPFEQIPDIQPVEPDLGHSCKKNPQNLVAAMAIWGRSQPATGTVVASYLRSRGFLGTIPPSIHDATGKHPADGAVYPMMVAAVIRPDNPPRLVGIHRTFLLPDGSGKARLTPDKMTLGPIRGGGVPLGTPGPKIAVCEGIETDFLSNRQRAFRPGRPCQPLASGT
jgi:putative DNA primase/helicase